MPKLWGTERGDRTSRGLYSLYGLWLGSVLGMTAASFSDDDRTEADCQQCSWSVREPTRQAALDAAKAHRRTTGHLVVLRE